MKFLNFSSNWVGLLFCVYSVVVTAIILILFLPQRSENKLQFDQLMEPVVIPDITGTNLIMGDWIPGIIKFSPDGDSEIIDTNKIDQGYYLLHSLLIIKSSVETNITIRMPKWNLFGSTNLINDDINLIPGQELTIYAFRYANDKVYCLWKVSQEEFLYPSGGSGTGFATGITITNSE